MKKIYYFLMLVLQSIFLFGCVGDKVVISQEDEGCSEEVSTEEGSFSQTDVATSEEKIYVYVCGHVREPGVYVLSEDERICDALDKAGGVTDDANLCALSQAMKVTDGQTIYVPGIDEETVDAFVSNEEDDGLVNINKASEEELTSLPGIGSSKASDIINYREEHGFYNSIEELMNIPGIKEGVFNKIKDKIKT